MVRNILNQPQGQVLTWDAPFERICSPVLHCVHSWN